MLLKNANANHRLYFQCNISVKNCSTQPMMPLQARNSFCFQKQCDTTKYKFFFAIQPIMILKHKMTLKGTKPSDAPTYYTSNHLQYLEKIQKMHKSTCSQVISTQKREHTNFSKETCICPLNITTFHKVNPCIPLNIHTLHE